MVCDIEKMVKTNRARAGCGDRLSGFATAGAGLAAQASRYEILHAFRIDFDRGRIRRHLDAGIRSRARVVRKFVQRLFFEHCFYREPDVSI